MRPSSSERAAQRTPTMSAPLSLSNFATPGFRRRQLAWVFCRRDVGRSRQPAALLYLPAPCVRRRTTRTRSGDPPQAVHFGCRSGSAPLKLRGRTGLWTGGQGACGRQPVDRRPTEGAAALTGAFGPESSIVLVVRLVLAKFYLREMRRVDRA